MHEMSITISMMEIIREEMARNNVSRLKRLKVQVGELTAVEPEALSFCFEAYIRGTSFDGAVLDIEKILYMGRCGECGTDFHMEGFLQLCPECEGSDITVLSGDELDIVSMEAD